MKREYIECQCDDMAHVIRISAEEGFLDNLFYLEVRLNQHLPWFMRIIEAFKYVFRFKGSTHYDCAIIDNKALDLMIKMMQEYKKCKKALK